MLQLVDFCDDGDDVEQLTRIKWVPVEESDEESW